MMEVNKRLLTGVLDFRQELSFCVLTCGRGYQSADAGVSIKSRQNYRFRLSLRAGGGS